MSAAQGVQSVEVRPTAASVTLLFDPAVVTANTLREQLESAGDPPVSAERDGATPPWRNPKVLASLSAGLLLGVGWLVARSGAPGWASLVSYLAAMVIGGYFFAREAIEELIFEREIGIELLMTAAAVAAAALGEPGEGATLVFLYSISEAAEGYMAERTRAAIKALRDVRFSLKEQDIADIESRVRCRNRILDAQIAMISVRSGASSISRCRRIARYLATTAQ